LEYMEESPYEKDHKLKCGVCKKGIDHIVGFLHCHICKYDLCKNCAHHTDEQNQLVRSQSDDLESFQ
jgi:hypothetical protein